MAAAKPKGEPSQIQRRVDTSAKYDMIKFLTNKFKDIYPNTLDRFMTKKNGKQELKTRSHIWLFSHLAFFEAPELKDLKNQFSNFLRNNCKEEIENRYSKDSQ